MKFVIFFIILATHTSVFAGDLTESLKTLKAQRLTPSQNIQKSKALILELASQIAAERHQQNLFLEIMTIELASKRDKPVRMPNDNCKNKLRPSTSKALIECSREEVKVCLEAKKSEHFLDIIDLTDSEADGNYEDIKCNVIRN